MFCKKLKRNVDIISKSYISTACKQMQNGSLSSATWFSKLIDYTQRGHTDGVQLDKTGFHFPCQSYMFTIPSIIE